MFFNEVPEPIHGQSDVQAATEDIDCLYKEFLLVDGHGQSLEQG